MKGFSASEPVPTTVQHRTQDLWGVSHPAYKQHCWNELCNAVEMILSLMNCKRGLATVGKAVVYLLLFLLWQLPFILQQLGLVMKRILISQIVLLNLWVMTVSLSVQTGQRAWVLQSTCKEPSVDEKDITIVYTYCIWIYVWLKMNSCLVWSLNVVAIDHFYITSGNLKLVIVVTWCS